MKDKFSVVIVCKNEAHIIGKTLHSVQTVCDDIVVYDSGSTDDTLTIARQYNARVYQEVWEGYGPTKQKAVALARHEWVLSIDADEVPDEQLQQSLLAAALDNPAVVYKIRRTNYLGDHVFKWGEFGQDWQFRLFNRKYVNWNDALVHEQLLLSPDVLQKKLAGRLRHYTMKDLAEFVQKTVHYSLLSAQKYRQQGKQATWTKRYLAPCFTFIKFYILKLGFLDGWKGLVAARMSAFATFLKYNRLYELQSLTRKEA